MNKTADQTSLLKSGLVVCDECLSEEDDIDRKLSHDGTYGKDKCDRCGAIPNGIGVQDSSRNFRAVV